VLPKGLKIENISELKLFYLVFHVIKLKNQTRGDTIFSLKPNALFSFWSSEL